MNHCNRKELGSNGLLCLAATSDHSLRQLCYQHPFMNPFRASQLRLESICQVYLQGCSSAEITLGSVLTEVQKDPIQWVR